MIRSLGLVQVDQENANNQDEANNSDSDTDGNPSTSGQLGLVSIRGSDGIVVGGSAVRGGREESNGGVLGINNRLIDLISDEGLRLSLFGVDGVSLFSGLH